MVYWTSGYLRSLSRSRISVSSFSSADGAGGAAGASFLLHDAVSTAHDQEQYKAYDHKGDNGLDEFAIGNGGAANV